MEISARQNPFAAWRDGRPGLLAGTPFPGARASSAAARARLGQCAIAVGSPADTALARLAETALANAGGRGDRNGAPGPTTVLAPPPLPHEANEARPMEVDAGHAPEVSGRPPGPLDQEPNAAAQLDPPPGAAAGVTPRTREARSPLLADAATLSTAGHEPLGATAPPAAQPQDGDARRGGRDHFWTPRRPPLPGALPAPAATQVACSSSATEPRPMILDLTGPDDASAAGPAGAALGTARTVHTQQPTPQRASRATLPRRRAPAQGQTAKAKTARKLAARASQARGRKKSGTASAAPPGPTLTNCRRATATGAQRRTTPRTLALGALAGEPHPARASPKTVQPRRRGCTRPALPSSACPPASGMPDIRRRRVTEPGEPHPPDPPAAPTAPHASPGLDPLALVDTRPDPPPHPVPALLCILRAAGGSLSEGEARKQLDEQGFAGHYDTAAHFWRTTGFLSEEGPCVHLTRDELITGDSPVTPGHWCPMAPPSGRGSAAPPHADAGCSLALLSLFDGTGMARVAIDQALSQLGSSRPTLALSAFAELQTDLAAAVQAFWNQKARDTGCPPHTCIANDVWDLFRPRQGRTPLHDFAQALPYGTCVLIVAGPPCQDLTAASHASGTRGLCGDRSCHFYATPLAAWCLQAIRPDLLVHVVVENVSSMKAMFKQEFARALNLPTVSHVTTLDSLAWCPFPRKRLFFSTLPPPSGRLLPRRRASPWDAGWAPRPGAVFHPMMRSRSPPGPQIQASTRNYHPRCLLYDDTSAHHWQGGDWKRVETLIRRLLPDLLRDSFTALLTGPTRPREVEALPVVEWMEQEGRKHGFRVPSAHERARAMGQHTYLTLLMQQDGASFSDRDLFDWTGSHFDPDAIATCIVEALANGTHQQPHEFLAPAALLEGYRAVLAQLQPHPMLQAHPVPQDLLAAFQATAGPQGAEAGAEAGAELHSANPRPPCPRLHTGGIPAPPPPADSSAP